MDDGGDESMVDMGKSFSMPSFLRKMFQKEVGEGDGGNHKLLVIVVHAVLINSGFVRSDEVRLGEENLVFFLNIIWANCDSIDEMNGKESFYNLQAANEVFEFLKIVKDKPTLPLLIDLCERAGLAPPPCFMCLPTDLKLKILESLRGVDVANMGSVCSEICYLSSNDDL
ncbi:F-box protein SKIP22 [Camellia lanceoleosa]|uniref:F-box protein SKIP22 n=1 Tax=Camellia lanceoleosa TaxID=1840588 RepID=A0ACC0FQA8_9ERIC|nr:F-box protein SKIP22 [Camellia lanceoleosa]